MIKIYKFFNRRIFHKLFGNKIIHIEAPYMTEKKLTEHIIKYNPKCYCITPINYEYMKSNFGCKLNKDELSKFLKKYYLKLKEKGVDLQLHVHLSIYLKNMTSQEKRKMITGAYLFFKNELGIIPKEIVFGWTTFDQETLTIVKELNILPITFKHFHVYDFWL